MRPTAHRAQNQLAMNDLPRCLKTCIALATGANHKMPSCEGKKELWRRDHTLRPWAVQAASWCAQTWQAQWSSSSVPPHGRPVVRASFNMIFYGVSRNQRWRPVRWLGRPQSQGTIHRKPVCKSGHVSRAGPWPGTARVSPLPSSKGGAVLKQQGVPSGGRDRPAHDSRRTGGLPRFRKRPDALYPQPVALEENQSTHSNGPDDQHRRLPQPECSVLGSHMEFPTITGVATGAVPERRIVKLDAPVDQHRQHDRANHIAQQFLLSRGLRSVRTEDRHPPSYAPRPVCFPDPSRDFHRAAAMVRSPQSRKGKMSAKTPANVIIRARNVYQISSR